MKQYTKPQLEVKSLVQNTPITADGDTIVVSYPVSWWPKTK